MTPKELSIELTRFFALANFDSARTAAITRLADNNADVFDRAVLKDRLDAYIRNGYSGRRKLAATLTAHLGALA